MNQTIHSEPTSVTDTPPRDAVQEITAEVVNTGRAWASHGLQVGKHALQDSARVLEITAETLARIAKRLEPATSPDDPAQSPQVIDSEPPTQAD
jgi:hypothetical protein